VGSPYETFALVAAEICGTPIAAIWLDAGAERQLEASVGPADGEALLRRMAFSTNLDRSKALLEMTDVTEPGVRFYVETPLIDAAGNAIGALCALDRRARALTEPQRDALERLGSALARSIEKPPGTTPGAAHEIRALARSLAAVADPVAVLRRRAGDKLPVFTYVNQAFTDLFGYGMDDVLDRTLRLLCGPKTDIAAVDAFTANVLTNDRAKATLTFYTASGESRVVQLEDRRLDEIHRIASFRDFTQERAAEELLADGNLRLQSLLETNSDAIFILNRLGACIDANPAARRLLDVTHADEIDRELRRASAPSIFPGGERMPQVLADGTAFAFESTYRRHDGRKISVACTAIPIVVNGEQEGAYLIATDVTERRRLAALAERQADRAQALSRIAATAEATGPERIDAALALVLASLDLQNAHVGELRGTRIVITNSIGSRFTAVNESREIADTFLPEMLELDDVLAIDDAAARPLATGVAATPIGWRGYIVAPLRVANRVYGAIGFVSRHVASWDERDRDFIRLVASIVSAAIERRIQESELNRLAYVDNLTKLPNRANFMRVLEQAVTANGTPFAIHFIDLDGFKMLNDLAGHAIGDLALHAAAQRLQSLCREIDTPARLGGDEFIVLQAETANREEALAFGVRILERLRAPYLLEKKTFLLGASIGIARYPADGADADTLIRRADAALYRAKRTGGLRVELHSEELPPAG
jgi:diguanylate cyclase (GGDEF)-like protein/PAS domain S-box-containing protein